MKIDKLVQTLKTQYPYEVFDTDIKQEEAEANASFFLFRVSNEYSKGESGRGLLRRVYVHFVTKDNSEINLETLIPELQKCGIVFKTSSEDLGKMQGTDDLAMMITMEFTYQAVLCL